MQATACKHLLAMSLATIERTSIEDQLQLRRA
jgi:hypothetical protein